MCRRLTSSDAALRDDFAVEVAKFFEKTHILEQLRIARPGGHDVPIARNRTLPMAVNCAVMRISW
jgi:hypothetical protein